MAKKAMQKLKYLENENSFLGVIKTIFHHFQRAFSCQKVTQTESAPLRSLSCRNQSTDLTCKSIDWFLYDRDLRHERVEIKVESIELKLNRSMIRCSLILTHFSFAVKIEPSHLHIKWNSYMCVSGE